VKVIIALSKTSSIFIFAPIFLATMGTIIYNFGCKGTKKK